MRKSCKVADFHNKSTVANVIITNVDAFTGHRLSFLGAENAVDETMQITF